VFLNLAINACEAMPESGTLRIRTEIVDEQWLKISFQDEGEGISEEASARLFEPFYTTKEGGTGLGLAIANKIVDAHGGKIEVQNLDGGGAEFSVLFPVDVSAGEAKDREEVTLTS
jgi:signal transduction histidine kinase